jgi:hypothetical protein
MSLSELRLTRDGVCRTFGLTHETLEALESQGVLKPDANHTFDLAGVAAALFHFGINQAAHAEQKLVTVAAAIRDVLPALQRLSELPDRAMLDTWARERRVSEWHRWPIFMPERIMEEGCYGAALQAVWQ